VTLVDRIHQLQLKAVAADDDTKIKSRAGEFTALRERLDTVAANAGTVEAGRNELLPAGVVQDEYEQNCASALAVVMDLVTTLENLSVATPFDAVKLQSRTVEAHFRNSEVFVASAWKHHLPVDAPSVDEELLDALERGGVEVEAIRSDIERARSALVTLSSRAIPEAGDNTKLREALETLNSSAERIGNLIDPAIADVVVRAQGAGVPYSEMTPEVISALTTLGILDRFRVVLK
jgi:hypothetical protein